jgi:prepilin-type processing-associated H-X9-DG protein
MRFHQKIRPQRAFTLTELMVIIAVSTLLIGLLAVRVAKSASPTKRAQCAANLRQFGLALQIIGNENEGRLPNQGIGSWAWDFPYATGTFVENLNNDWTVMYCPGTSPSFTQNDNWTLYNYVPNSFRVIGYATTLPGTATVIASNINSTLLPERIQISPGVVVTPSPADRVLLADATISGPGQNSAEMQFSSSYYYVGIPGGYLKPHLSAHLSGRFPAGGNLTMLDGHVEWRKFKDMSPRTAGGSPGFWW